MQVYNSDKSDQMFKAVYEECCNGVPLYANKMLANLDEARDVSSDSFIKLWLRRNSFHSVNKMKAFLKVCTTNTCLNRIKSLERRERRQYDVRQIYYTPDGTDITERLTESREAALIRVIKTLDKKYQDCIFFFYFEKLPVTKIASRLNITERNVRFYLTEGRKMIKSALISN
jgi:RNA polymerase sigma factor (sigma-70 family)